MTTLTVALTGAGGFVGSAVQRELRADGHLVTPIRSPRLTAETDDVADLIAEAVNSGHVETLAQQLVGADVLVNAAGDPDASSTRSARLLGANALLPRILLEAAASADVPRLVHVSSAVVQNDKSVLDDGEQMQPFSAYSQSKAAGEMVLRHDGPAGVRVVRYRPPSVHAPGRRITRRVAHFASSPLASVARPGSQPTPQALLPNVAAAVAFLATTPQHPPAVVIHPWEGLSVAGLMTELGGRPPRQLPRTVARLAVEIGRLAGRLSLAAAVNTRRLELLWLGQRQQTSWLTRAGWQPVVGPEGWYQLGRASSCKERENP